MPHHPSEEETSSNVFDQVAKESKDSNASDHPMHAEEASQTKATASDHASKGPQIVEKMGDKQGTKDELKAKAQEMNK